MVLDQLKLAQLRKLAVSVGSACSGNKAAISRGILQELPRAQRDDIGPRDATSSLTYKNGEISVLSIDMGVQNLAYAHMTTPSLTEHHEETDVSTPILRAWDRLSVFAQDGTSDPSISKSASNYSAAKYAIAAHSFITQMVEKHQPSHVLIEQQRFRSGGSSAVQEWSLRVGVFEGMLHAVLRTLREQQGDAFPVREVTSVSPARIARFWLGEGNVEGAEAQKTTGREGKQAKIDIVGRSLDKGPPMFIPQGRQATAMAEQFLQRWRATASPRSGIAKTRLGARDCTAARPVRDRRSTLVPSEAAQPIKKLDDLADSVLQGLAWIQWQKTRQIVASCLSTNTPIADLTRFLERA